MFDKANQGRWWDSKNWLYNKYYKENKILSAIAQEIDVSASTIFRAMKKHNIKLRDSKNKMLKNGANNGNWKGELVSYSAFHKRL